MPASTPVATYRLQFNRDFGFGDARRLVPYLHQLGFSHIYASPLLKARSGSSHGYDIVDHTTLNPDLGSADDFESLVNCLHSHDMGLIVDIVPNHMGVGGCDNHWWLDVLEHGEASVFARYFDIDWHPAHPALNNRLLLPFLGDHYGKVLERGELKLQFHAGPGSFQVHYFDHCFPVDPRTYPMILAHQHNGRSPAPEAAGQHEALETLLEELRRLPRRSDLHIGRRLFRRESGSACQQRLAQLCRQSPPLQQHIQSIVSDFNGKPGLKKSFDDLHRLLERQAYRLAYWKVAADEINYRRFFDINELAALRMEDSEVFAATHQLIIDWFKRGWIDGVRVDHIDGLSDPLSYCRQLRLALSREDGARPYIVVEKILAGYERLRTDWPVQGSTGYDFAALVNGVFVDPEGEAPLTRLHARFVEGPVSHRFEESDRLYDDILYQSRKTVIRTALSSELSVLANALHRIALVDRNTRDFTYLSLRDALTEIVACFPVYRTYLCGGEQREQDHRYLHWAIARGQQHSIGERAAFEFIEQVLLRESSLTGSGPPRRQVIDFCARFQQYTATVAAKGMEDTAFYRYYCLPSLNDVGFDPRQFCSSPAAFHNENRQRGESWPYTLLNTSTHDSKRGEDVRARLNVLSELASEWRHQVLLWKRLNRSKKTDYDSNRIPSELDEYLFYLTLAGSWPLQSIEPELLHSYRKRIGEYMLKAAREAKLYTSWKHPDEDYENGLLGFINALLSTTGNNAFLRSFVSFHKRIVRFGLYNGLAQVFLKYCSPGVPDTYQGNELWQFNLADPDNRRRIDFPAHGANLDSLNKLQETLPGDKLAQELLSNIDNGLAKLFVVKKTLGLRRTHRRLFEQGEYLDLTAQGERKEHLCVFARQLDSRLLIVIASRFFARLLGQSDHLPTGPQVWGDTLVVLDEDRFNLPDKARLNNLFTGKSLPLIPGDGAFLLQVHQALADFPLALLSSDTMDTASKEEGQRA